MLYIATDSQVIKDTTVGPQAPTEYRFSDLEAATDYKVGVQAFNGRNTGLPGYATARTSDGFPSAPTDINRLEEDTHCDISWSSPAVPRGAIIGYNVYVQGERLEGEYSVKSTTSTNIRLMKSTKTEILDLLPNSVYTINVTGFTYTGEGDFSQTVNCTVPPGKPSKPDCPLLPEGTKAASTTFPLQIQPASDRNGPIGCYHVIVVNSSSTDNLPDPDMLQPYKTLEEAKNSGYDNIAYIAMALTSEEVGESTTVTVGDGTVTSCKPQQGGRKRRAPTSDDVYNQEYTNSPLEPDSSYTTSVRAYGPNDGTQPYFSTSQYTEPVSIVCVVVLLGIVAAAVMYYCRRKKATKMVVHSQRTGTDNPALEMAPGAYNTISDNTIEEADNANNVAADNENMGNNDVVYDNVPADTSPLTDFTTPIPRNRLEEVYNHRNSNQIFREEFQEILIDSSDDKNDGDDNYDDDNKDYDKQ
ncbi:receptor-type tyrosine-protein phosphatase-like [Branchiostoma lanceolatum]|uniref:receptor-type tyrosine-protein phosphatase-like n=1 Tax=Branchiostoma lanceolatum TaxID=7740 RepID=UPI003456952A